MGDSTRQFKALMRKNWINWKRSPKCSFCEICCASYVFLVLVWIRTLITVEEFNLKDLAIARHPVLPTMTYSDEKGTWNFTEEITNQV